MSNDTDYEDACSDVSMMEPKLPLILVLDIDNTLLHAHTKQPMKNAEKMKKINTIGCTHFVALRPGASTFLRNFNKLAMKKEIVMMIYTAGTEEYVRELKSAFSILRDCFDDGLTIARIGRNYNAKSFSLIEKKLEKKGLSTNSLQERILIIDDKVHETWQAGQLALNGNVIRIKPYYHSDFIETDKERRVMIEDLPNKIPFQDYPIKVPPQYHTSDENIFLFQKYESIIKEALDNLQETSISDFLAEKRRGIFADKEVKFADPQLRAQYHIPKSHAKMVGISFRKAFDEKSRFLKQGDDILKKTKLKSMATKGVDTLTKFAATDIGAVFYENIRDCNIVLTSLVPAERSPLATKFGVKCLPDVLTVSVTWLVHCLYCFENLPIDPYILNLETEKIFLAEDIILHGQHLTIVKLNETHKKIKEEEEASRKRKQRIAELESFPSLSEIIHDAQNREYCPPDGEDLERWWTNLWEEREKFLDELLLDQRPKANVESFSPDARRIFQIFHEEPEIKREE